MYQVGRTRRICTEANANEIAAYLALKRLPRTCTNWSLLSKTLIQALLRTRQFVFALGARYYFFLALGPREGFSVAGRAE